jgi:ferric-dicitrate binding protein FerR (iron transport regulator)
LHIDDLITRSLEGRTTADEQEALAAWRSASPANEARFQQLAWVWTVSGQALTAVPTTPPPAAAVIRAADSAQGVATVRSRSSSAWRWLTPALAAAAMLVVGIGLGRWSGAGVEMFAPVEVRTAATEMASVELSDGTLVRLAPDSRIRFSADVERRELWLEGRAFVGVAHQADRPFVVRTRLGEALVLGTRFEVNVERDDLRVVVVEGRVALSTADGRTVEVGHGHVGHARAGEAPTSARVDDVLALLDWMETTVVFHTTPLVDVARELSRRYTIPVVIRDSTLARRTVSASFTNQPFEQVLAAVCVVVSGSCTIEDGTAYIDSGSSR